MAILAFTVGTAAAWELAGQPAVISTCSRLAHAQPLAGSARAGPSATMGIFNRFRFRQKRKVETLPQITEGTTLPDVKVEVVPRRVLMEEEAQAQPKKEEDDDDALVQSIREVLGDGKSFLVGMPGAFTPVCTDVHLPGILRSAPKLASYGVDKIAVVTTNDRYVMDAWRDALRSCIGADSVDADNVVMLSDGDGDLVRSLGLVDDMGFGVGVRSKRFALFCEDGVVSHVAVDEGMDSLVESSAEKMIALVKPKPVPGESNLAIDNDQIQALGGALAALAVFAFAFISSGNGGGSDTSTMQIGTSSSGYQTIESVAKRR
eukprot:scaffold277913_cov30-Tisochrysis_lutea.AAC.1